MSFGAAASSGATTGTSGVGAIEGLVKNVFRLYDVKSIDKLGLGRNERTVAEYLIRCSSCSTPVTARNISRNTPLTYTAVKNALDGLEEKGALVKFTAVDAYAYCGLHVPRDMGWLREVLGELGGSRGNNLSWHQKLESKYLRYPYVYVPLFKNNERPVYEQMNFSLLLNI